MKKKAILTLVQLALLTGIELIFAFTPLGSLPIGPIVATLAHIPVIIAAVVLGYGPGIYMGFLFGFLSFIVNSFVYPTATSFVFTPIVSGGIMPGSFLSLVICFVPRIMLGVVSTALYRLVSRWDKKMIAAAVVAALGGSLAHTALVLGGIYVFFGEAYAATIGQPFTILLGLIMSVVVTNGLPEAAIAAVVAAALVRPLSKFTTA